MKITGHQTAHVFRHYDLGNIDVLRERLAGSRPYVRSLKSKAKVRRLSRTDTAHTQRVAG
jgi:hypothetical protein